MPWQTPSNANRTLWCLALAAAIHVAAGMWLPNNPHAAPTPSPVADVPDIAVELILEPHPSVPSPLQERGSPESFAMTPSLSRKGEGPRVRSAEGTLIGSDSVSAGASSEPARRSDGYSVVPEVPGLHAGIFSSPSIRPSGGGATPQPVSPSQHVDRVLTAAIHNEDVAKSVEWPGAGALASRARTWIHASTLPGDLAASLIIDVDADGRIVSIRCRGRNVDEAVWAAAAAALETELRAVSLPAWGLPRTGLRVSLDVTSKVALPSGATSLAEVGAGRVAGDLSDLGARHRKQVHVHIKTTPR